MPLSSFCVIFASAIGWHITPEGGLHHLGNSASRLKVMGRLFPLNGNRQHAFRCRPAKSCVKTYLSSASRLAESSACASQHRRAWHARLYSRGNSTRYDSSKDGKMMAKCLFYKTTHTNIPQAAALHKDVWQLCLVISRH